MSKRILYVLVFLIILMPLKSMMCLDELVKPPVSSTGAVVNVMQAPKQNNNVSNLPISLSIEGWDFAIKPLASYEIAAKVKSKKAYWFGWQGQLAPYDLALVWQDLTTPIADQYITYSQNNRWYFFRYKAGCPISEDYIYKHSANNHIIPANLNVKKGLDKINTNDIVLLKGYLVRVDGKKGNETVWWVSSLSRDDRGNHSCEVFYVTSLSLNSITYQ